MMIKKATWGEQIVARAKSDLSRIPDAISQQVAVLLDGPLQQSAVTEKQRREIAKELIEKMELESKEGADPDEN